MTTKKLLQILQAHGIKTRQDGGKVQALETGTINGAPYEKWIDASGWTLADLKEWLGY